MRFEVIEPSTGRVVEVVPAHGADAVERKLASAAAAQRGWAARPAAERALALGRLAELVEERADVMALRMAREVGKPVAQGVSEARKCAVTLRYYAENAAWLDDEPAPVPEAEAWVRSEPMGVILAIMPWNFPYWQVFRFAAPALLAGNGFVLKHAPSCPGVGRDIEALFVEAGLPDGLAPSVVVDNDATSRIIADPRIAAVTLTGSTRAGRAVAQAAGKALKKCVLELGGSDPFVVLPDADVDAAARAGAQARLLNAGQSCIAAKRFIVHEAVAGRFIEALRARLAEVVPADPYDPETALGPLARRDLRRGLHEQVERSVVAGAELVLGGEIPQGPGFFYPPTLLTGCAAGMPAWDQELFGPVAALTVVRDDEGAMIEANRGPYGLGASVWTRDRDRAARFASDLACGAVFVNGMTRSDPRVPFGGLGDSGYGRELGRDGLREWLNRKTVWIDPS
jgi:succinate-semialdehyde dehydrogenase / glutarate-semialdehyde dehydrogenase